jgi:hypothetical protein
VPFTGLDERAANSPLRAPSRAIKVACSPVLIGVVRRLQTCDRTPQACLALYHGRFRDGVSQGGPYTRRVGPTRRRNKRTNWVGVFLGGGD